MKTIISIILIFTIIITLQAQAPVKKDLMQMAEKYPPPPASVKEAYNKIGVDNENRIINLSAEKLFEVIENEATAVEAEYVKQQKNAVGAPGVSSEDINKMRDPEIKKKMKGMTKEEKMKMAMDMAKGMSLPVTETDPPEVVEALQEWSKIHRNIQKDFDAGVAEQQEETKLNEEYKKSHEEINKWEQDEINKLPQISSGEMSAPDPAKVKEVKLRAADKHIALANKRLEKIRSSWRASVDKLKTKYGVFHQKLIAANYAADSKNFGSKKTLSDAQRLMFESIKHQIEQSRKAWEESASWQARRVDIEKQKIE
jgi:hypothetical protein